MRFIKKIFLDLIALLIILGYGAFLYVLKKQSYLTPSEFINNVTIFIGWIVALLAAWIHLQKTRKDNQLLKREEIKKTLEIDAFREINKGISEFSSVLSPIGVVYITLPGKLKLHRRNPDFFKFNIIEIDLELSKQTAAIHRGHGDFLLAIEGNEIAVIDFDYYKTYIQFQVEDTHELIQEFIDYFNETPLDILITKEGYDEFKRRCFKVHESLTDIRKYFLCPDQS